MNCHCAKEYHPGGQCRLLKCPAPSNPCAAFRVLFDGVECRRHIVVFVANPYSLESECVRPAVRRTLLRNERHGDAALLASKESLKAGPGGQRTKKDKNKTNTQPKKTDTKNQSTS